MVPGSDIFFFHGLRSPVAFSGCETLYPLLSTVLRDWPMEKIDAGNDWKSAIWLQKIAGRYWRHSQWLPQPAGFRDPVDTVCDFIVDLIHAYVAEHAKFLCLHGAALELKTGLMVFPNTYRAGKSILALKLVSCGARLFSDDVLPIGQEGNSGTALGILPRLRLPLPETAGGTLTRFIDQQSGPQNTRYRYIRLNENELAKLGTEAPVTAITLLRRSPGAKPALQPGKRSDVVRDMILRNFARQNPAIEIVDRLHAIVEQAECFTLTYDTPGQAAALLEEAFGLNPERKAT